MAFYNLIKLAEEQQSSVGENVAKGALAAGVGAGAGLGVGRHHKFVKDHGRRLLRAHANLTSWNTTPKHGVDLNEFVGHMRNFRVGNKSEQEAARKYLMDNAHDVEATKKDLESVRSRARSQYSKLLEADMPEIRKAGYKGALIGAGTGLAAIGAKKLYDHYKKD